MKGLSINMLRILSVLTLAILIAATVKAFDGMEKTAAEYQTSYIFSSLENR